MRLSEVLTNPAEETRVMVREYRFRLRDTDKGPDVWLDSGNLADWLGDAVIRVDCVEAREETEQTGPATRFEAYLDGELIGEIHGDAEGSIYYALA
jgi:hypothetical protein